MIPAFKICFLCFKKPSHQKLFLVEGCPLINVQEMMQLGDHDSATLNEITVSGTRPPWTLQPLGESGWGGPDVHVEPQHYPIDHLSRQGKNVALQYR